MYVAAVIISFAPNLLATLILSPGTDLLFRQIIPIPVLLWMWGYLGLVCALLSQAASIVGGALLIVFCIRQLASRPIGARPLLGLALGLGGLVGLELALTNIGYFGLKFTLDGFYPMDYLLARLPYHLGMEDSPQILVAGYIVLYLALLGLFIHMRRPGAAVTR